MEVKGKKDLRRRPPLEAGMSKNLGLKELSYRIFNLLSAPRAVTLVQLSENCIWRGEVRRLADILD